MKKNHTEVSPGKHEHPLSQEISQGEKDTAASAHEQADKDMGQDADFAPGGPNDDLDEGESARLGEDTPIQ